MHSCEKSSRTMDKLSHLTIIFGLVVLCALPLYCELKIEGSLNVDVMNEVDDITEAIRTKRRPHNINYQDSFQSRKLKQTPTEDLQTTLKHKRIILRYQSRYGKQRNLNAISAIKENERQKSGYQEHSEYTVNKNSVVPRYIPYSLQKFNQQDVKDDKNSFCIANNEVIDETKRSHISNKRSEVSPMKSGNKYITTSKIKLIPLNELKSGLTKRSLDANKTVNDIQNNVSKKKSTGNLSTGLEKDEDDDNETFVAKRGQVKQIQGSQNESTKSKEEGTVPVFYYLKIYPHIKEFRKYSRIINSKQLQEPQDGYNKNDKDDYNEGEDDYDEDVGENNEDGGFYIKYRNPVILDEVVPQIYVPQPDAVRFVNNRTKFSRILSQAPFM